MQEIVIADDQEMYRTGVVEILSGNGEFHVVAQSSDWSSLLTAITLNRGALVITSASLVAHVPQRFTRAAMDHSRVLMVTEDSDRPDPVSARGPAGIIQRSSSPVALMETLRRVKAGRANETAPA